MLRLFCPSRGAPQRACLCWVPLVGRHRDPVSILPHRPGHCRREGPMAHIVPAVGIRRHPRRPGKTAAETSASSGITASGLWEAAQVLTSLLHQFRKHSTYLPRLASWTPSRRPMWRHSCHCGVRARPRHRVAGQHWPPPATSTQLQPWTGPQVGAEVAAGGQDESSPAPSHLVL